MEKNVFVKPAVAEIMEDGVIEARLHADTHPEFGELELQMLQTVAQPVYIIVPNDETDPEKIKILARRDGATLGNPQEFIDFLKKGIQ